MKPTTTLELTKKIETLEEELEFLKIKLFWASRKTTFQEKESIVQRTAGLLGKKFPRGVDFENESRRAWRARQEQLGL